MTLSSQVKICDEARMWEREMRSLQEKVVVCLCSSSMVQNEGIINHKILFDSNFFGHEIIWTNILYEPLILFGLKFFDRNFFQTQHFFELDFCGHQFF